MQFATVYVVEKPFLHSKVYELQGENSVATYTGSANLTTGGLLNNQEMMVKVEIKQSTLEDCWEELWQNAVTITDEVMALYESFPVKAVLEVEEQHAMTNFLNKLGVIYTQQCIESRSPDLTDYYFGVTDYIFRKNIGKLAH